MNRFGICNIVLYFLLGLTCNSCSFVSSILVNSMFKDARVETTQSTRQFQLRNHFDTTNSFIVKADTSNAYFWLEKSVGVDFQLFDCAGNLLQYGAEKSCSGAIFYEFIQGNVDGFISDSSGNSNLQNLLHQTYTYQENSGDFNALEKADFYVVAFWSQFAGGKLAYADGVKFYEDQIKKYPSKKIVLIKINTDLQENWGMVKNGMAKVKVKVKKREATLHIGPLPWKNH